MYVNDPSEKALLPEAIQNEVIFEEEPRDYHEFFGDDVPFPRAIPARPIGHNLKERNDQALAPDTHMLYTQICRLNPDGSHFSMARNCPHFDEEDEQGRRITPGWTAQSGSNTG